MTTYANICIAPQTTANHVQLLLYTGSGTGSLPSQCSEAHDCSQSRARFPHLHFRPEIPTNAQHSRLIQKAHIKIVAVRQCVIEPLSTAQALMGCNGSGHGGLRSPYLNSHRHVPYTPASQSHQVTLSPIGTSLSLCVRCVREKKLIPTVHSVPAGRTIQDTQTCRHKRVCGRSSSRSGRDSSRSTSSGSSSWSSNSGSSNGSITSSRSGSSSKVDTTQGCLLMHRPV
jgi:hypothetical protein